MVFGGGLLALVVLVLWVYCILDVIASDESVVRNLPKIAWLFVVIFVPSIGSVAWLLLGRPLRAEVHDGNPVRPSQPFGGRVGGARPRSLPLAPDDDPQFLSELDERTKRLRAWEEDLKRREDELRRREDGGDAV
jgi:Phospholipase_D-nuclease N-terminal